MAEHIIEDGDVLIIPSISGVAVLDIINIVDCGTKLLVNIQHRYRRKFDEWWIG